MFSNRFYYTKLLISLGIVLLLFVYSYRKGLHIDPAYRICKLRADEFNGYELWVPSCILTKKDGEIIISNYPFSIPVKGAIDEGLISKDGKTLFVEVVGRFVKGSPSYIEIKDAKKIPLVWGGRRLIEDVSLVTLLYVAILFFKTFEIKHRFIFE